MLPPELAPIKVGLGCVVSKGLGFRWDRCEITQNKWLGCLRSYGSGSSVLGSCSSAAEQLVCHFPAETDVNSVLNKHTRIIARRVA